MDFSFIIVVVSCHSCKFSLRTKPTKVFDISYYTHHNFLCLDSELKSEVRLKGCLLEITSLRLLFRLIGNTFK